MKLSVLLLNVSGPTLAWAAGVTGSTNTGILTLVRTVISEVLSILAAACGAPIVSAKLTALLLLVLLPAVASAGMTRSTIQVSAYVVNNCAASVPSSVILPTYSGTQVRSSIELQLRCTKGASPIVSLGGSMTAGGGARVLIGADGGQLAYQVYSDPSYNSVWNAVTEPPADGVTLTSYALYWAVPSGQTVSPGTYANNLDVAVDPGTRMAKHYTIRVSSRVR
jgi:spore coat protein U-like protein